ncbi:MAG: lipid A biosynthesis myristoyltransferase LpxN [Gammaproteobacteria bacterium]|nr:MAG: lipid A biosynthesis myristoyltransferase LpxN [Gammaproteobacteria bacterium]
MSSKESNKNRYRFRLSLLHPRNWLTWAGLVLFFIITLLPLSLIDDLGCRLGKFAASKNKKRFNIAATNLSLCFPEKSTTEIDQMTIKHFQAQFRSVLHYFILWWRPTFMVRKKIVKSGFEQIEDFRKQGKNIIILLVHSVGLEFASPAITLDYNTVAPYKKMRNPVIDWLIANARMRFSSKHGGKLFSREEGLRPLIREVRAGNILVYLADEDLGEKNSIFVPFYGVPKATLPVLGRLAKSCNAVVLPCVSCYEPENKRYAIKLLPKVDGLPSGDDVTDSLKMNEAIESAVEQCPIQYFWTLRYFQTRPEGEASVYES